jgi:hypothetical protein
MTNRILFTKPSITGLEVRYAINAEVTVYP